MVFTTKRSPRAPCGPRPEKPVQPRALSWNAFAKGSDLSRYSHTHLNKVALQLNQRPRETLGFDTPANVLHARVASTD